MLDSQELLWLGIRGPLNPVSYDDCPRVGNSSMVDTRDKTMLWMFSGDPAMLTRNSRLCLYESFAQASQDIQSMVLSLVSTIDKFLVVGYQS